MPTDTQLALAKAAARLYMEPRAILVAFKKDPVQTLAAFSADPKSFGELRTYVGVMSVRANIMSVRRLLKRIISDQVQA